MPFVHPRFKVVVVEAGLMRAGTGAAGLAQRPQFALDRLHHSGAESGPQRQHLATAGFLFPIRHHRCGATVARSAGRGPIGC